MKLEVELRETGAVVRGGVRVLEGGSSRSLAVSLQYCERSPDYTHTAIEIPGGVLHTGDLRDGMWFDFAMPMPPDALPAQTFRHGETWWQVDVKSDERGVDTHAVLRLDAPRTDAVPPPPPPPPPPTATDASGAPLLAPGYSARAQSANQHQALRVTATIVLILGAIGVGIWQGLASGEPETTTVPVYTPQPQPYTPPFGGEFDLNACNRAAAGDPQAELRCIREYNRSITETP